MIMMKLQIKGNKEMTLTKMIIPKTITVGFRKRADTYTGKLAFVIYTDNKGKLRKELSWNGWRDEKIKEKVFDNIPMSGFVLNRGVGGARESSGWDARNEYIRVYDPRGFEFEISVANLLFILQECSSVKGKGLEGEFVYSWDRVDLVLLPVTSQEYKSCSNYTENQSKKITKKDMVEGCSYTMKDMTEVMYLGRHNYYEFNRDYVNYNPPIYNVKLKKKHIFLRLGEIDEYFKYCYITQPGFTKLAVKTSSEILPQFSEEYEKFKNGYHGSPIVSVKMVEHKIKIEDLKDRYSGVKVTIKMMDDYVECDLGQYKKIFKILEATERFIPKVINGRLRAPSQKFDFYYLQEKGKVISREDVLKLKFYRMKIVNEKGFEFDFNF